MHGRLIVKGGRGGSDVRVWIAERGRHDGSDVWSRPCKIVGFC